MSPTTLPEPALVLAEADWGSLDHAYGRAEDTPAQLVALLDDDQRTRSQALDHLHYVVHHQQTLYDATVPATLYVAAILPDPRTALPVDKRAGSFPGPMRAELLGWLNSVADAVSDEAEATMRRLGLPQEEHLPFVRIREIRPLLFLAISSYFADQDRRVREAALAACIPLLDDPALKERREDIAPLLRAELATSALWQYQERAVETLSAWGESTADLEIRRDPFEVFDAWTSTAPSSGWDFPSGDGTEPPF